MKIEIKYDGKYPNLCSGQLIVNINNKEWVFPECCLQSGGLVFFDKNFDETVTSGEWTITRYPDGFPERLKEMVENEINLKIRHGCCGGCV